MGSTPWDRPHGCPVSCGKTMGLIMGFPWENMVVDPMVALPLMGKPWDLLWGALGIEPLHNAHWLNLPWEIQWCDNRLSWSSHGCFVWVLVNGILHGVVHCAVAQSHGLQPQWWHQGRLSENHHCAVPMHKTQYCSMHGHTACTVKQNFTPLWCISHAVIEHNKRIKKNV